MQQQITKISTEVLKVHPRNQEFFDDIEGKDYKQFKKSIEEEGIITPLIIAPDMTVVSGHQRLKTAIELGIKQIPVIIREDLEDEDEKLKKLLASNFGRLKNDEKKQRKIAVQYVELCNPKQGRQKNSDNRRISMKDIAEELGTSESTLYELLEIERKLTPEIKELIDNNIISKTSASKIWVKLSSKEQNELLEELGKDKIQEMTQQQLKQYIEENNKIVQENLKTQREELTLKLQQREKELQDQLEILQIKLDESNVNDLIEKNDELKLKERTTYEQLQTIKKEKQEVEKTKKKIEEEIAELKNKEPEVIEKEVIPDDIKEKLENLKILEKNLQEKEIEIKEINTKYEISEKEVKNYQKKYRIEQHYLGFRTSVNIFLDAVSPLTYKKDEFKILPKEEKEKFQEQILYVEKWVNEFKENIA